MSEQNQKKLVMAKDTLIYMFAKIIEGVLGVLTISAMTYIYLPQQIGKYSTINITITTIAMVCIQWLIQSSLRYINKYQFENKQKEFYSTVFFSWLKINLIIILCSSIFILFLYLFKNLYFIKKFLEIYNLSLLVVSIFMFFTYNTSQLIISLIAGARKSTLNLILSVINVFGKFFALIFFNKFFPIKIEWIFLSYIIFDFITIFFGVLKLNIFSYISFDNFSKEILQTLKVYGIPLMGNMISISILNKSDIYIITAFLGDAASGIYQTNYSIIASAFILLATGAMRGAYPTIVHSFNEGKLELAKSLIQAATRFYLLIGVPAVFGVFSLSDYIAISLFDNKFFEGNNIMGFVALGMLFLALTEYAIKPWELTAKTKEIFKRSLISGILNIILNLLFIKRFGYKFAGFSTFISFFVYFILAKSGTKSLLDININKKSIFNILLSSFFMYLSIIFIKFYFSANIFSLCLLIIFGLFIYSFFLYILGEIKYEVNLIKNKIFKK